METRVITEGLVTFLAGLFRLGNHPNLGCGRVESQNLCEQPSFKTSEWLR
jgi:hypothetical protein